MALPAPIPITATAAATATPAEPSAQSLLEQMAGGPLPEWSAFAAGIQRRRLQPGQALFEVHQPWPWLAIVGTGLFKLVYRREGGSERIKSFITAPGFFTSLAGLPPGGRTSFAAIAMERATVELLSYPAILALADRHLAWQRTWRVAIEQYGARKEKRERELLTLTPEERYALFLSESPGLAERIPQKDLALYLGITPVGLSRMRGRMAGRAR